MSARPSGVLAGIAFVVLAVACFATLDTTTKFVSASVPLLMALWFRYAFQALATTLAVLPMRGLSVLRTAHPKFQVLRGLLLLLSSLLAFLGLKSMPVGEFTAVMMITPLVITLLPLGLVASNAWFQLLTSRLARTEDPITMHLYTGWVGTLAASLALPLVWTWLPQWRLWALLCLMGLLATVGHFLLILAYKKAPASTLTPYLYAQIAFAMLGGWLVFWHVPDTLALAGIGMIAVCGAAGAWLTVRDGRGAARTLET